MNKAFSTLLTIVFMAFCMPSVAVGASSDSHLKNYLLGQFEPKEDALFVAVPALYSCKAESQYLRKEAMDAFRQMADAAKSDGITLKIVSATRTFFAQKTIWEAKWNTIGPKLSAIDRAKAILHYSSMPGTSRHHWGTDVDINSVEPEYFAGNQGSREYEWLVNNANAFGFSQPYTAKSTERPAGYEEEKWHWSYMPLAREFLQKYASAIAYSDITGFDGSQTAQALKVIDTYVHGIDPACK